jgi:hypothetical protein
MAARRLPIVAWRAASAMLGLLALCLAAPASAHLTPNSEIMLEFAPDHVAAHAVIPLGELEYAMREKLPLDARNQPADPAALSRWLAPRIGVTAADGRAWTIVLTDLRIGYDAGPPDIRFNATLRPPPGAALRAFLLRWEPVLAQSPNHFALVLIDRDFAGGHVGPDPKLIGGLQAGRTTIAVDRGDASMFRGFGASIGLGMHHIAEGHDHLLFLITLLIPAPLIAIGRRWSGYAGLRVTLRHLVGVVTAFTIGHSVTLVGGAFFHWKLPAQPVEALIALSILISALHGFRPIFPRREMLVAGGFGLVHGLAFATLIGGYGLDAREKALSILGFNLGIEAVQLIVVACTMPALILVARTRWYDGVRVFGAAFAGIAAFAWLAERLTGVDNAIGRAIDIALGKAPIAIAVLTVAALILQRIDRHGTVTRPA